MSGTMSIALSFIRLAADEGSNIAVTQLEQVHSALETLAEQSQDLERKLRGLLRTQNAQGELEAIEARLWTLAQLKRKLKRPLAEIVQLQKETEANLSLLDSSGLDLKQLERRQDAAHAELLETLEALDADRRQTARTLSEKLGLELRDLGFSEHLKIEFSFLPHDIFPGITEYRPRLLWAPNPGHPFQALDEIASGGELSRVLLANDPEPCRGTAGESGQGPAGAADHPLAAIGRPGSKTLSNPQGGPRRGHVHPLRPFGRSCTQTGTGAHDRRMGAGRP